LNVNNEAVPIPFQDMAVELLALYEPPMRAKGTYLKMRQALEVADELLGLEATTADLTIPFIGRFVSSRPAGESPYTTFGLLANVRAACIYGFQRGYLKSNPFDFRSVGQWVRRGEPQRRKRHHSLEEIARVLELMSLDVVRKKGWAQWRARRLHALASVVAFTGLRKNEAIGLKVEDVLLDDRIIEVVPRLRNRLKTVASGQPVPIPEALAPILADWLPWTGCEWVFPNAYRSSPWVGGSPGYRPIDRMKRLGQRAGVEGFTFQSLRHSWATHAEWWGISEAMIMRILRHTSVRTQQSYRHADIANMRAAVGGITFGPPTREAKGE
jgi:integrase